VRIEVDEPERAVGAGAGADVGLRDRVVPAEDDRDHARADDLAHQRLERRVRALRVGRKHRRVAEVDEPQLGKRVDPGLEVRPGRAARGPDRARPEARPRSVGDEVVRRRADDGDVVLGQQRRVLRVRQPAER
jgi:hypothetical protein